MPSRLSSTSSSASCFRWAGLLALGVWLTAAPALADVCVWRDPERTMQKIFPQALDYKTLTVRMTPERVQAIEKALGAKLDESEKSELNFYEITGNAGGRRQKIGTVIALAGKGEYGVIEVVIGVEGNRIVGAYLQRSRERATRALQSGKFLNQFVGKSRADGFEVPGEIQPASPEAGAASRVVAFVIKKMLVFQEVLAREEARP